MHQGPKKRTAGKPNAIPYGSMEYINYQEAARKKRMRRGFVGRTAAPSYYTKPDSGTMGGGLRKRR